MCVIVGVQLVDNYNLKQNIGLRLGQIINTMSDTKYLVIFYGVSAGQNGDNLGSDEQDLVMLIFLVINTEENKVRRSSSRRRIFKSSPPTQTLRVPQ